MYNKSFGQAGSPYELWPIPFANLAFNTGSVKSGFFVTDIQFYKIVDFMRKILTFNLENFIY